MSMFGVMVVWRHAIPSRNTTRRCSGMRSLAGGGGSFVRERHKEYELYS